MALTAGAWVMVAATLLSPLAVADPALHLGWVNATALITLVLVPAAGWFAAGRATAEKR
ncbi:MAG: hypothetical protein ABIN79_10215 [Marmoricola sp.]